MSLRSPGNGAERQPMVTPVENEVRAEVRGTSSAFGTLEDSVKSSVCERKAFGSRDSAEMTTEGDVVKRVLQ